MKKYFCDRCGLEVVSFLNDLYGYRHLCFNCKDTLDSLHTWDAFLRQGIQRLSGGES